MIPSPVYTDHRTTVAAHAVKAGDVVQGRTVGIVKVGPKNAELLALDGKRITYVQRDHGVPILRRVETEESKAARHRAMHNERIQSFREKYKPGQATKAALAKMNASVEEGQPVDSFRMADFINAQAGDRVEAGLVRYLDNAVGREGKDGELLDEVAVVELYKAELTQTLLQIRGTSRSTSVVSNVMEDAEFEAMAHFIKSTAWWL